MKQLAGDGDCLRVHLTAVGVIPGKVMIIPHAEHTMLFAHLAHQRGKVGFGPLGLVFLLHALAKVVR